MPTVTLTITVSPIRSDYRVINILGEGFIGSNNKSVGARMRGQDTWFDDKLFPIPSIGNRVTGSEFYIGYTVHQSRLNEDWGQDEIYAVVEVEDAGTYNTNVVKGYY